MNRMSSPSRRSRSRSRSPPRRPRSPTASPTATATPRSARCSRPRLLRRHVEDCTGTLIAPNVFLTAAHCDDGRSRVAVTFDSSYTVKGGTEYWGTFHADPAYDQAQSDPHDIAVVVLDKHVDGDRAGAAADGRLARATCRTGPAVHVGRLRGAERDDRPRRPDFHYADIRYFAVGRLNAIDAGVAAHLHEPRDRRRRHLLRRLRRPELPRRRRERDQHRRRHHDHRRLVCRATNVNYRLDTPSARAFLGGT